MDVIGEKYDFSERLRALMKMKPKSVAKSEETILLRRRQTAASVQRPTSGGRITLTASALERGEKATGTGSDPRLPEGRLEIRLPEDTKLYLLLKDTVNYFSIDHTERGNPPLPRSP